MRRVISWVIALLFSVSLYGSTQEVTVSDVRKVMHELFAYHVASKELTPELYQRSIKICVEQFDPNHVYLLESEAESFISLSPVELQNGVKGYYQDDFTLFDRVFALFQKAQLRHQAILSSLTYTQLEKTPMLSSSYARSEQELRVRIQQYYMLLMLREAGKVSTANHNMKQLFSYVQQKQHLHENVFQTANQYIVILKAFAKSLDAHSGYYSPSEAIDIRKRLQKQFAGTGVVFKETYQGVFVSEIMAKSPAGRDGKIQKGDKLLAVNAQSIEGKAFSQIMEQARGEAGSKINFTFGRGNTTFQKTLIRETLIVEDARVKVKSVPFSDGIIAVVTVPAFYDNGDGVSATEDFKAAIREAKLEGKLKGIVIDMRDNAGGFLSQAIKFSGLFIAKGIVVISRYSDGEIRYSRDIDGRYIYDGPLVLLTSKASASCTEIVAQALQDYGVALVVGDSRTYGKGSMQYQTITDQYAKAYYKVTVGRYYTASGRSTQLDGVLADINVPTAYAPFNIGEKYLQYPISPDHLTGEQIETLSAMHAGSFKRAPSTAIPYLQPRETIWRKMKSTLAKNSKERIENNTNYQNFLKRIYKKVPYAEAKKYNYGANDLQVQEAVSIVQDMILLSQSITVNQ